MLLLIPNHVAVCSVTQTTDRLFQGGILEQSYILRDQVINGILGWEQSRYKIGHGEDDFGEYDDCDNIATRYFIVIDLETHQVLGVTRMLPTTLQSGYMLKNTFQDAVADIEMPESPKVWEMSRIALIQKVDSSIQHKADEIRQAVWRLFMPAYQEFSKNNGIETLIGLAPPNAWKVHTQCGIPLTQVGPRVPVKHQSDNPPFAATVPASEEWLKHSRKHAGLAPNKDILYDGTGESIPVVELQYA